jgi:hypothetical protein
MEGSWGAAINDRPIQPNDLLGFDYGLEPINLRVEILDFLARLDAADQKNIGLLFQMGGNKEP